MAEWGALLRRCPCKADRGFKSLPLRQMLRRCSALLAVFVGFSVLLPASPASAAACTQFHTAKPNDSWTRISARFGVSLRELLTLNQATTETSIFIGDKLCVSVQQVVQRPTATYTRKQVRAIIREVWPDELEETALFVAQRESNLVHTVIGGKGDCCYGLFQMYWSVHRAWLASQGITSAAQLLDPRMNAEAALTLYRRNGNSWRPWWTGSWRP